MTREEVEQFLRDNFIGSTVESFEQEHEGRNVWMFAIFPNKELLPRTVLSMGMTAESFQTQIGKSSLENYSIQLKREFDYFSRKNLMPKMVDNLELMRAGYPMFSDSTTPIVDGSNFDKVIERVNR